MSIQAKLSEATQELTIKVAGRFDYNMHAAFRQSYESIHKPIEHYVLDFTDVVYLDSSALGMLLLLREHAGGECADIKIIHASETVKELFELSNFSKLFEIN